MACVSGPWSVSSVVSGALRRKYVRKCVVKEKFWERWERERETDRHRGRGRRRGRSGREGRRKGGRREVEGRKERENPSGTHPQ